jgi:hypothetical protein
VRVERQNHASDAPHQPDNVAYFLTTKEKRMNQTDLPFGDDRPIKTKEHDLLGFAPAAEHIANAILEMNLPDSY